MATTTHPHAHPRAAATDEVSLARQLAAPAWTVGVIAVVLASAMASTSPAPGREASWSGRIGPATLDVAVVPVAGAAEQTLTLTFTRPRSGSAYDIPTVVRVRLRPGGAAAASRRPVTATRTGPGVWAVRLAGSHRVARSGVARLRVSALVAPGHALKRSVPLAAGG
jgi:hypothetical protein